MLVKLKIENTAGKLTGYTDGTVKHFKSIPEAIQFLDTLEKPPLPFNEILEYFNECNGVKLRATPQKKKNLMSRRKYTCKEIKRAIYNRSKDPFMIDNKYRENWDSLFRNDEQVEKWLTREPYEPYKEDREVNKAQVNLDDYLKKIGKN